MNAEQVIGATRAWIEKAVIGLNLCPFAQSVYLNGQVRFTVSDAPHADAFLEQLDAELDLLAEAHPAEIDTTLLIHPFLFGDFETFNDITDIAEDAVAEHGLEGVIQIASFHPAFQFAGTDADDITNATNRSPYPTLHLLREDSVTRALANYPEPERIYERNLETMRRLGIDGWKTLNLDAKHDRKP